MSDDRSWIRRHRRLVLFVLLLALIEATYVAIITAGRFTTWPTWNTNYDLLAEGFRSGHLYLSVAPSPELLAKANPFHPGWRSLWFWDASLHGGHYYLYWGPLPAVAIAAVKTMLRINAPVGDQFAVFAFYTIHLVAGAALIARMSQRLFDGVPLALTALCIAVFAYANPTPYLLATPGIYEAAIAGGQAFLLLGLLLCFEALWRDTPTARRRLLIAAGLSWGFAFACRASSILPEAILVVITALAVAPPTPGLGPRAWRQPARPALWLAAPIAAVVAAHLAYNKLRFDAWFEFGLSKQLSTMQFRTAPGYLLPNLYSYLFRPLHTSCRFPFVSAPAGLEARAFPGGFTLPRGYTAPEPVAGLVNATPWILLAGVAVVLVAFTLWRARRAPGLGAGVAGDRRARASLWCIVAFLVLGTVTGLAEITEFFASMRFLGDVAGGLVLAGAWAALWLHGRAAEQPWPARVATAVLVGLGGATIAIGLLLGLQGYDQMFQRHNPELFARWVQMLSRC